MVNTVSTYIPKKILKNPSEITPTTTVTSKFFEITALKTVGKEASKLGIFSDGSCPKCCINKFSNHKADMIAIGTKLKNSTTPADNLNFFKITNGIILDSQVAIPDPKIVKKTKLEEGMLHHHPKRTS